MSIPRHRLSETGKKRRLRVRGGVGKLIWLFRIGVQGACRLIDGNDALPARHRLAGEMSLGSANRAYRDLVEGGLAEGFQVTEAGFKALSPYKVDNAVILAAGLSSRFAPISYEKPKGVLRVRGEVLIERQIEQLHDAGVDDVTVVVGYKKEHFFYLAEKYGVRIVVNPAYCRRNNNSSLMAVRELLGNTYVCSSDDYFTENPFEPYVYRAYYAVQYQEGFTKEWCMKLGPKTASRASPSAAPTLGT